MPDYDEIYIRQAEQYELLTSYEDCQGKLLQALSQIRSFEGLDIVEFGAGTGRLTDDTPLKRQHIPLEIARVGTQFRFTVGQRDQHRRRVCHPHYSRHRYFPEQRPGTGKPA